MWIFLIFPFFLLDFLFKLLGFIHFYHPQRNFNNSVVPKTQGSKGMKILSSSIQLCVCESRSAWEQGGKPWKVQREGRNDASGNIHNLLLVPHVETFYFVLWMA